MAAVGGLKKEYEGRVNFTIVSAVEQKKRKDLDGLNIGNHGLVGYAADGTLEVKIPGHNFGEKEIRQAAEKLL